MLRLEKAYGAERLEAACAFALTRFHSPRYRQLRTILAEKLGYSYVGEADGIFGSSTEKAVEDIQGSGADGIVGPLTWDQIATLLE